jgi:hypothetical protein
MVCRDDVIILQHRTRLTAIGVSIPHFQLSSQPPSLYRVHLVLEEPPRGLDVVCGLGACTKIGFFTYLVKGGCGAERGRGGIEEEKIKFTRGEKDEELTKLEE